MSGDSSLISNPTVWYAGAMAVFLLGVLRYARKPILGALDSQIEKIRNELEEAKRLRAEAEATLKEYEEKQKKALSEADQIIKNAKEEAERLRKEAEADLQAMLKAHEQRAADRIRLAEEEALAEVRSAIIDEAIEIARKQLTEKLDAVTMHRLIEKAIKESAALGSKKIGAA